MRTFARHTARSGRGFTLTELLVVVMLVGVLGVLVGRQMLAGIQKTGDSVAQSLLRSAAEGAANAYGQDGLFTELTSSAGVSPDTNMQRVLTDTTFVNGATAATTDGAQRTISWQVSADRKQLVLATVGQNESCWAIRADLGVNASTWVANPTGYKLVATGAACTAASMAAGTGWVTGAFPERS